MTVPFDYPPRPHQRRHGPRGYADYGSYRPWLRDEFSFRCVYCLLREQWGRVRGTFNVDHFHPVVLYPAGALEYENLLYACTTCNLGKADRLLPDPTELLTSAAVQVAADGTLRVANAEAGKLIELLGLDGAPYREFRSLWIEIIALAAMYDAALYRRLMGFPDDLPNLARLRPPGGNASQGGIASSFHAQRAAGTLPVTY